MDADKQSRFEWDGDVASLAIPNGLTYENVVEAAKLVDEWLDSGESPIPLVIEVFALLSRYKSS